METMSIEKVTSSDNFATVDFPKIFNVIFNLVQVSKSSVKISYKLKQQIKL